MDSHLSKTVQALASVSADFSHLENDCLLVHFDYDMSRRLSDMELVRSTVEGMMCIILLKGTLNIDINSDKHTVSEPSLIVASPGTLLFIDSPDWNEIEAWCLAISREFLQNINISFAAISGETFVSNPRDILPLRDKELPTLLRYFKLMHTVMSDNFNIQLNRHVVSNIIAAFFYQTVIYIYKRLDYEDLGHSSVHRNNYVHEFMKLVHLYYTKERSVNFYASKLFISPKYLSLLVKEATGRSAARWIDFFVISEAKNLLRFSGKNIQQVAYALNFSNQSSFGKYFKHLTGMSPTDFQKML